MQIESMRRQLDLFTRRLSFSINQSLSVLIRDAIVVGTGFRFATTFSGYDVFQLVLFTVTFIIFALYAAFVTVTHNVKKSTNDKRGYFVQATTDTFLISALYFASTRPSSDFFLYYFLPLLLISEHFNARRALLQFSLISVLYASAFIYLTINYPENDLPGLSLLEAVLYNFVPRWFFFVVVLTIAFVRHSTARAQSEELEAVHKTAIKISNEEALESRLEAIMDAGKDLLNAEGCIVYLRVPNRDLLKLVAVKGVQSPILQPGYLLPFGQGMAGRIMAENLPHLIENDYTHSSYKVEDFKDIFEAVIEVPLYFADVPIGVLAVFDKRKHHVFTKEVDLPIIKRLAQYAAVAIHERQLVDQLSKQTRIVETLRKAGDEMNSSLDVQKTWNVLVEAAWNLVYLTNDLSPMFSYLAQPTQNDRCLEFVAAYPPDELAGLRERLGLIDLSEATQIGIIGQVVRTKTSQNIPDVKLEPAYIKYHPDSKSQLAVPIKVGDEEIIGVLSIEASKEGAFTDEAQKNIESLALQASAAIRNVRLLKDITIQAVEAQSLLQVTASANGLVDVADGLLKALPHIVPYTRATLQLIEGDARRLLAKSDFSDDLIDRSLLGPISDDQLIKEVLHDKSICLLSPPEKHPLWKVQKTTSDIRSWIAVPLVYGNQPIGLITLDSTQMNSFTKEHVKLLELFTPYATSILQNAISFQQNTERLERLVEAHDSLKGMLEFFGTYYNLALIGVIYGEDFHYAQNLLGMASARAGRIAKGLIVKEDDIRHSARLIVRRIERYLLLLEETRNAALSAPAHDEINLHQMLDGVIASKRIGSNIHVVPEYGEHSPIIYAPEQLRRVFLVIIQNALDAMPSGGTLLLRTQQEQYEGAEYVLVSISDTGGGIPKDLYDTLFEPRVRDGSSQDRHGTGMGLAWAYAFLRVYRGSIGFSSELGKGTTMRVSVPRDFRKAMPLNFDTDTIRSLISRLELLGTRATNTK